MELLFCNTENDNWFGSGALCDEAGFYDYIAAFNRGDRAVYGAYYSDDVTLVTAGNTELHGRQAIFDFYEKIMAGSTRAIQILNVVANSTLLAAELQSEFLATKDMSDFPSGPMARGDRLYLNSFAFYNLDQGKFVRIRAATFKREFRPTSRSTINPESTKANK